MSDTAERPLRFCDICGGLDDHPRHVRNLGASEDGRPDDEWMAGVSTDGAPVQAIEQLVNGTVNVHHMDCGAAEGCELCKGTEKENKGFRGQKLINHLNEVREA